MRILFICDYLPIPVVSGDRVRVYNLLRRLAAEHEIHFASFAQRPEETGGAGVLEEFCRSVTVLDLPRRRKLARIPRLIRYVLSGTPFDLEFLDSPELAARIRGLAATVDPDIVHVEPSHMAPYTEALPTQSRAALVVTFHNVASVQYERISRIALQPLRRVRAWLHGRMLRRWEPRYAERFDRCITVSGEERRRMLEANPTLRISVVDNGVDTHRFQPRPEEPSPPGVLLIGTMSYAPCADGAIWFGQEVLPRIRESFPELETWIVGFSPPEQVRSLAGNGVHVTGAVEDVVEYYDRSTVSIVPLRAGAGTRLKILEAMALGRPVVSTSIGCEGLQVDDGQHLLIADDERRFANCVVRLLRDERLRRRIARNAREFVVEHHDWDALAERQSKIYREIVGTSTHDSPGPAPPLRTAGREFSTSRA